MAEIDKRLAELNAKIAARDFSRPVKPIAKIKGQALIDKEIKLEDAKREIRKGQYEEMMANRNVLAKIWTGIKQATGASLNLLSSFDFSGFRQAFFSLLGNSARTLIPLDVIHNARGKIRPTVINPFKSSMLVFGPGGKMFSGWATEARAKRIEQQRTKRKNWVSGAYEIGEVHFSDLNEQKFTKQEELAHSILDEWAALPFKTGNIAKTTITAAPKAVARIVRMSNRAFITLLNETRADLFDHLLELNFKDRAPTTADLKVIGNLVNIATGRGRMPGVTQSVGGKIFWAPALATSRVQTLIGQPLWTQAGEFKGSGRSRAIVAKEYARVIASGFLLWQVGQMFSDKEEKDPTSSDYGKIVRGNVRIDPWGGYQQFVVLTNRTLKGETKGVSGKVRKNDLGQIISNFARNKLRPDWGALWNTYDISMDTVKPGHPKNFGQLAKSLVTPLPLSDIVGVLRDRGFTEGMIIEALGSFGAGINVYDSETADRKQ